MSFQHNRENKAKKTIQTKSKKTNKKEANRNLFRWKSDKNRKTRNRVNKKREKEQLKSYHNAILKKIIGTIDY